MCPNGIQARSLDPLWRETSGNPSLVAFAEAVKNAPQQRAIVDGNWKLLFDPQANRVELYNLAEDAAEQSNLAALYPDRVQQLEARLQAQLAENDRLGATIEARDTEVSEEALRQFQAVGYFGGGAGPAEDDDLGGGSAPEQKPETP